MLSWIFLAGLWVGPVRSDVLPPPVIPQCVGVNIHFTGAPTRDLEGLKQGGFGWVRMDFVWDAIEKVKGRYDFSAYDTLVAGLTARGIKPLFILDYGNDLYQTGAPSSPEARAAFARFAAASVRHYRGKPILWEIWNEPNGGFWKPQANAGEYGRLAFETAKAIKQADPKATVLAPGTSGIPLDFLESVFRTGILRYLDAVSLHPYRGDGPEAAAQDYPAVRRLIEHYVPPGKSIPLVSSEWGYSTTDVSEKTQAQYLARQWLSNLAEGVRLSIWYDWHEDGTDPKYNEHHFGTVRFDYTPKPAFLAAQRLTQALGGYRFVKRLPLRQNQDYLLLFAKGASVKVAYWTTADDHRVSLPGGRQLALTRNPQYGETTSDKMLSAAASWTVDPADTFYTAGQTPRVAVSYHNRDAQPHQVQFVTEVTTLDNSHSLSDRQQGKVASGRTVEAKIPLSGYSHVQIRLQVRLVLDGVRQPYSQDVSFAPTDPLELSVAPLTPSRFQVQIANPGETVFVGRLSLSSTMRGGSVPIRFKSRQESLAVILPSSSEKEAVCLLRDTRGSLVARLPVPRFVPINVVPASLRAVFDGDAKVPSTMHISTSGSALRVDYRFAPGWSFLRVPAPSSVPLTGKPVGIGLWIYGDGSGNLARMRIGDATGQTFQANGLPIDWMGWRFVTFRLVPPPGEPYDVSHWGGANDGHVHYPVRLDTLFLLDSRADAHRHEGTIWFKSPVMIYEIGP